jgi:hypothetical protein
MLPDMECTMWPEGWWHHCCVAHDLGGTDFELAACVIQSSPHSPTLGIIIALVMFAGVKLFRPILRAIRGR